MQDPLARSNLNPRQTKVEDQPGSSTRPKDQELVPPTDVSQPQPKWIHSPSFLDMVKAARDSVSELGFQKYRASDREKSYNIMFAITNQGQSTGERWRTFPLVIEIYEKVFSIKVIFTINNESFRFTDENLLLLASEFITRSNWGLQIGYFNISLEKRILVFESKGYYLPLSHEKLGLLIKDQLMKSIASYKIYAFGIVTIIDYFLKGASIDVKRIVIESEKRNNIPRKGQAQPRPEPSKENEREQAKRDREPESSESSGEGTDNDEEMSSSLNEDEYNELWERERNLIEFIRNNDFLKQFIDFANLCLDDKAYKYEGTYGCTLKKYLELIDFDRKCIDKVNYVLKLMYENDLEFKTLPSDYITVQEIEPGNLKIQLIPVGLYKVAHERTEKSPSAVEYSLRIVKELNALLCQVISDKSNVKCQISSQDWIGPENFLNKSLMAEDIIIGHGGFGDVYRNELYGQDVAIKFPREVKESETKAKRRIAKELQMMKCLPHENIVKVYGVVEYDQKIGLVLEFCSKGALNSHIKKSSNIMMEETLRLMYEASLGLEFMHCKEICHFDIKPHNMFLSEDLTVKLADFGMSEHLEKGKILKPGFTLLYCSPEQIKGDDPRLPADVWSLGMSMYYTSHGRAPFEYIEKIKGHKPEKKEFYQELKNKLRKPKVSEDLEKKNPRFVSLMREMWSEAPDRRPPMRDVRKGLQESICLHNKKKEYKL